MLTLESEQDIRFHPSEVGSSEEGEKVEAGVEPRNETVRSQVDSTDRVEVNRETHKGKLLLLMKLFLVPKAVWQRSRRPARTRGEFGWICEAEPSQF